MSHKARGPKISLGKETQDNATVACRLTVTALLATILGCTVATATATPGSSTEPVNRCKATVARERIVLAEQLLQRKSIAHRSDAITALDRAVALSLDDLGHTHCRVSLLRCAMLYAQVGAHGRATATLSRIAVYDDTAGQQARLLLNTLEASH